MGHRWDVIGRHIAIKGATGAATGAALGAVAAGAGALPGAGVGAAMGMFKGLLSGTAQVVHEEFLTNMAKHRAERIKAGKGAGSLGALKRFEHREGADPKAPGLGKAAHHAGKAVSHARQAQAYVTSHAAKSVEAALSAARAKAPSLANQVKNAAFEAKHRRVHGRFA